MRSTIKRGAVLALLMAAFAFPTTASAGDNFKFSGDSADAFFSTFDGCVFTDVFVFASDGVFQSPPGPGAKTSSVGMFISQFDECTSTQLLAADGFADLGAADFVVASKLASATLSTTVNMFDFVSNTSFDVDVNLTWAGSGPTFKESGNFHFSTPGCKFHSRFRGTFRSADTSGTVTDGVTNFTPEAGGGSIGSVKSGDLSIGCN